MPDINVKYELEKLLANKPYINIPTIRRVEKTRRCHMGPRGEFGVCDEEVYYEDEKIIVSKPATLTNTCVVSVNNLTFGDVISTGIPENLKISRKIIKNAANANVTSTISLTVGATESWSVTKTKGVSTTLAATLDLSFKFFDLGAARTVFSISQTVSTSTALTEGGQKQVSRTTSDTITIGPYRAIKIELLAYESPAEVPFSATVVVDGDVISNSSGISIASNVLSLDERTFSVEGVLRVVAVSEGYLSVSDIGKFEPSEPDLYDRITTGYEEDFTGKINERYASQFSRSADLSRQDQGHLLASIPKINLASGPIVGDGAVIDAPDGVHHEILYTTKEFQPTPSCGFNDFGIMNLGVFEVEVRRYTMWDKGYLVSTWEDRFPRFISCWII